MFINIQHKVPVVAFHIILIPVLFYVLYYNYMISNRLKKCPYRNVNLFAR